eukprot:46201_1
MDDFNKTTFSYDDIAMYQHLVYGNDQLLLKSSMIRTNNVKEYSNSKSVQTNTETSQKDSNEINERFTMLNQIDIRAQYLVFGYLREQEFLLFNNQHNTDNASFNLQSIVTFILLYCQDKYITINIKSSRDKFKIFQLCVDPMIKVATLTVKVGDETSLYGDLYYGRKKMKLGKTLNYYGVKPLDTLLYK